MYFKKLLCLVVTVLSFGDSKCNYNFFVSKQYMENKYYCVTNTSFALSWIHKDKQETADYQKIFAIVSSFIPTIRRENYFDCDFNQNDHTSCTTYYKGNKWILSNSTHENVNEIILDQRWEGIKKCFLQKYTFMQDVSEINLETIKTEFKTDPNKDLIYKPVLSTLREDFEIPFSIRSDRESHIFLCDGDYPPGANCYWFMLQAWKGDASAIRKCTKNYIPEKDGEWPKKPCNIPLIRISHPSVPFYLSNDYWSHLKIIKKNNNLSLIQASSDKKILEWTENSTLINVTHMIIHNKMVDAFWKIHEIEFIYTKEIFTDAYFGPAIQPTNGLLCISMYLLMCTSCQLNLTLVTQDRVKIAEKVYNNSQPGWSEIKFVVDPIGQDTYYTLVSTIGSNEESFWAIDKVRQCQNKEFRMISTNTKAPCQLMSKNNNAIAFDNNSKLNTVVNDNCSEYTIGEFCVPCNWIYDKCEKISICSKDEVTNTQRCYCSAGYQNYNECYYECDQGRYGPGCTKNCSNCGTQCNIIDGTCKRINGTCPYYYFTGPKCDIVTTAIFAKSPQVTNITYTKATVQVNSFELQNSTNEEPISYTIQIKPNEKSTNWTDVTSNIKFYESLPVPIKNLKPGKTYLVRGIINIKNRDESYNGDQIPIQNFTTKCEEINKNSLTIIPFNTSVQIITQQNMKVICETIINFEDKTSAFANNTIFNNLEPFTDYTIRIQTGSRRAKSDTNEISFRTTEGTPTTVQNLQAMDKTITSSSITLKWVHPRHIYGYLQHYVIEYKHLYYKSCQKKASTSNLSERTNDTTITIKGLIPFSAYSFKVYATNNKFNGIADTLTRPTQALEYISKEEIPNIMIKTKTTEAIVKLSEADDCKGPLSVICTLTCLSEWCQNITKPFVKLPKDTLALTHLMPFSNYSLTMKFCRNNNLCSETEQKEQFQTKPSVPNPIKELLVYSKDEDTISLRWRSPYPPTGILEHYKIEYNYRKYILIPYSSSTLTNENTCKLWPNFHCAKLTNLGKNTKYTIMVYAKNKVPDEYSKSAKIETTTTTEKSEAPGNLKFKWTLQNNLEVEWTHPIKSNGVIQYFQITLDNQLTRNKLTKEYHVTEETYQRNYTYTINSTDLLPTTKYTVTVTANNGYFGKNAKNVTDESPPDIPSFKETPQFFSATNTTITVNIQAKRPKDTQKTVYLLFLLISDKDSNLKSYPVLKNFILKNKRLVCKIKIENFTQEHSFTIGNQSHVCNGYQNPPLKPQSFYNVTLILTNTRQSKTRHIIYSKMVNTTGTYVTSETNSSLLALLSLLLIIPIAVFLIVKKDKLIEMKNSLSADNDSSNVILNDKNESQIPLTGIEENEPTQKPKKPTKPKTSEKIYSKCIQITDFENYVKECVHNGEFERQHALFPRGQTKPWTYGVMKENKSKNRYNNLIAYDHSRVILEKLENDPYSDYINASYIDGHRIPKAYIATQGPKPNTLFDFWRMIWQENVEHIVMLANVYEDGKKKVEKYWPAINEALETGNITIQHVSNTVFADFEHRIFNITRNGETRQVDQLHFLSWPDHGIPLYSQSIVPFLQKMLKFPLSSKSPIVVHCSAGVGRTGTILLCDICLRMAAREGSVDALRKLQKLRGQRANLVDNVEQYKLAHLVIMECLVGMHTTIPCNEISSHVEKLLKNDGIALQMQYLKDTKWQDEAMKTIGIQGKTPIVVQEKNRFPDIIPEIQGRVFICRDPYDDETSSYINAIKVDGFRSPGRYIVTQQPLPNTVGDFWRLIEENDVSVIISLNEIDPKDETSCNFWPNTKNPQMSPVGSITLKHTKTLNLECYDLITVHLNNNKIVEIYSIKDWPAKKICPKSREQFLTFWEDSDAASRRSKTVVVTCYDGVKASGLYVAMSFVIEKMKLEHSCDVCQAVRTVRHNRNQFVQEENQFIFLYQAAVDYINGFQSYANFS